jgi:hypothetical protein
VGNGNDIAAQAPTGHIITAIGSFDNATTGVTGETGQVNGQGGQVANAYSLQLNSDPFVSTAICAGANNPSICRGWEQFIYESDGTAAKVPPLFSTGFSGTTKLLARQGGSGQYPSAESTGNGASGS